jgi:hypothetical protein
VKPERVNVGSRGATPEALCASSRGRKRKMLAVAAAALRGAGLAVAALPEGTLLPAALAAAEVSRALAGMGASTRRSV